MTRVDFCRTLPINIVKLRIGSLHTGEDDSEGEYPTYPEALKITASLLSSLELSDTQVYAPEIRALLGTAGEEEGEGGYPTYPEALKEPETP